MSDREAMERSENMPEVFGLLFDRHFDEIAKFCIRRIGAVQGEDLAGDVFQWAFENRRSFDPEHGAVRSWLFRIANNRVRNARRRAGRQDLAYVRWSTREGQERSDPAMEATGRVDAEHDLRAVAAVLDLQPAENVDALLLFAWEELSYAEIAEVLSVPIGTVRSRISRVRRHLHEALNPSLVTFNCPTRSLGGSA